MADEASPRALPVLAAAIFLLLVVFAFVPQAYKGPASRHLGIHAAAHVGAFWLAFRVSTRAFARRCGSLAVAAAVLSFGAFLELAQAWRYGTPFEFRDVVFDAIGMALGLAVRIEVRLPRQTNRPNGSRAGRYTGNTTTLC
jgi:VanZ family protein